MLEQRPCYLDAVVSTLYPFLQDNLSERLRSCGAASLFLAITLADWGSQWLGGGASYQTFRSCLMAHSIRASGRK
jgi:hypothetical protein